jgi:hypothetical protein
VIIDGAREVKRTLPDASLVLLSLFGVDIVRPGALPAGCCYVVWLVLAALAGNEWTAGCRGRAGGMYV